MLIYLNILKLGVYTVKNKFYYEDEPLNEEAKSALLNAIIGTSKAAAKAVPAIGKVLTSGYGTFKKAVDPVTKAVKSGPATAYDTYKAIKADKTLSKGQKVGQVIKKLGWENRTDLGKAKAIIGTGLAAGAAQDVVQNKGQTTKNIAKDAASTAWSGIKLGLKTPSTLLAGVSLVAATTSNLSGIIAKIQSNFNAMYATYNCFKEPGSEICKKLVQDKLDAMQKAKQAAEKNSTQTTEAPKEKSNMELIKDEINKQQQKVKDKVEQFKQIPTSQKVAAGVGGAVLGLTAAAVAAKAIKDSFEKKDWYNKKCAGIQNPEQKEQCHQYVYKRTMKELQTKLKRCKLANNPQKCVEMITAKIQELNKKTD